MALLRIDYCCLRLTEALDGRVIYDNRIIESFRAVGADVNVIEVDVHRARSVKIPLWAPEVSTEYSERLRNGAKVVVSHEMLIPLALELAPDIFIIHNFFPSFSWRAWSGFQAYCRLGAEEHFKCAIHRAKNTIVLSARERAEIAFRYGVSVVYEPPGIQPSIADIVPINLSHIRRSGSARWYPKRRSLMSERQIRKWFGSDIDLGSDSRDLRGFALIEDQFLSGFKLKLLEHLYNGEFIVSRADLRTELRGLGISEEGFLFNPSKSLDLESVRRRFLEELTDDFIQVRRQYLESKFSWNSIAKRIISSYL